MTDEKQSFVYLGEVPKMANDELILHDVEIVKSVTVIDLAPEHTKKMAEKLNKALNQNN